jgi:hypothetical protein
VLLKIQVFRDVTPSSWVKVADVSKYRSYFIFRVTQYTKLGQPETKDEGTTLSRNGRNYQMTQRKTPEDGKSSIKEHNEEPLYKSLKYGISSVIGFATTNLSLE